MSETEPLPIQTVSVKSLRHQGSETRDDTVAVEEPMEIRIEGEPIAVTMRTPGHDAELAAGFVYTEGVVSQAEHIQAVSHAVSPRGGILPNVLAVTLDPSVVADLDRAARHFYATSSCGICGKGSLEQIRQRVRPIETAIRADVSTLAALPDLLRESQRVFGKTGGLHAAGLFSITGELLCAREDVGRHNAVDKVIGWAILQRHLPLDDRILMISGRASFEIMQKALVARIPVVAAVSAPSSLAVDLARENGLTLVGFLRGHSMNIYSGADRIE